MKLGDAPLRFVSKFEVKRFYYGSRGLLWPNYNVMNYDTTPRLRAHGKDTSRGSSPSDSAKARYKLQQKSHSVSESVLTRICDRVDIGSHYSGQYAVNIHIYILHYTKWNLRLLALSTYKGWFQDPSTQYRDTIVKIVTIFDSPCKTNH